MTTIQLEDTRRYYRDYHKKRRAALLARLGDRCVSCGSTDDLEFDHIDPELKSFNISRNLTASNVAVQAELAKCQLLCRSCHIEKTARENSGWRHGTLYGYLKRGCRCEECRAAKRESARRQRKSSSVRASYGRDVPHGDPLCYTRGCRCDECKSGHAAAERARVARKRP